MDKFYHINIAGLERDLPICPINENLYIAGFVMFSDVEMTVRCAEELLKKHPNTTLSSRRNLRVFLWRTRWRNRKVKIIFLPERA